MDHKTATEKVFKSLHQHSAPDPDFQPLAATNEQLAKVGLPRRPDEKTQPSHFAKWKRFMSKPIHYVTPTFVVNEGRLHHPAKSSGGVLTSSNWSGAVINGIPVGTPAGDRFTTVSATWVVPIAYPPASAWNGTGWNDGHWHCAAWVGLDGLNEPASTAHVFQAGTVSEVITSGGRIIAQDSYAWFEWFPAFEIAFSNFTVTAGDTVSVALCAGGSTTSGFVAFSNVSTHKSTSTTLAAPAPQYALTGQSAEWIMEDDDINGQPWPFPYYGDMFFLNCDAGTQHNEYNLSNATVIDLVQNGATLSSAVELSPNILECLSDN